MTRGKTEEYPDERARRLADKVREDYGGLDPDQLVRRYEEEADALAVVCGGWFLGWQRSMDPKLVRSAYRAVSRELALLASHHRSSGTGAWLLMLSAMFLDISSRKDAKQVLMLKKPRGGDRHSTPAAADLRRLQMAVEAKRLIAAGGQKTDACGAVAYTHKVDESTVRRALDQLQAGHFSALEETLKAWQQFVSANPPADT